MPTKATKRSTRTKTRVQSAFQKKDQASAAATIRRIGDDWARHWNARELDGVVAIYDEDAVYLPPHHEAVHGRQAIREYVKVPLGHGVSDLAFEVTYIKQKGSIAWDIGTYRMTVPRTDASRKDDRGKYLTVWRRTGKKWLIVADAWSSDLPVSV